MNDIIEKYKDHDDDHMRGDDGVGTGHHRSHNNDHSNHDQNHEDEPASDHHR